METKAVIEALSALAQESRLAAFRLLVQQGPEGLAAGTLAERLSIPPATLSFHLKELTRAGLISQRQEGRFVIYSTDFTTMDRVLGFLTENCCQGKAELCRPRPARARARFAKKRKAV